MTRPGKASIVYGGVAGVAALTAVALIEGVGLVLASLVAVGVTLLFSAAFLRADYVDRRIQ